MMTKELIQGVIRLLIEKFYITLSKAFDRINIIFIKYF